MSMSVSGISDETMFYCYSKRSGVYAKGCFSANGFKIFKGSTVSQHMSESLKKEPYISCYRFRSMLENEGIITNRVFRKDYVFPSAYIASTVILGLSINGNQAWYTKDGITLGELRRVKHEYPAQIISHTPDLKLTVPAPKIPSTETVRLILTKYFPDGFRPKINLDYIRFRNYAESEGFSLPPDNDTLSRIIESEGTYLDGSVFIVSKELIDETGRLISKIQDTKAEVIFYSPLMNELMPVLTQHHIYSLEMFRDLLHANFNMLFFSKDSFTFSNMTQDQAVLYDILRVWGEENALFPHEIEERLPYIPFQNIQDCLRAKPDFVKTAEGKYFLMKNFSITSRESAEIYRYAEETCKADGYVSLVNIPCDSVKDNNIELTGEGLYTVLFEKVLKGRFYRKHKIITDTPEGPNTVDIFRNYCRNRDECTFGELNRLARDLTGRIYPMGVLNALYEIMIRISKENFTADYNAEFDIDGTDRAISLVMAGQKFIPIRGITTFAVFPDCGQKWNHYVLESFCYRFSRKYGLRFYKEDSVGKLTAFNSTNIGIIAVKNLDAKYNDMLAEILSRQRFDLTEENAGKYFQDAGLMWRSKFDGLSEILSHAKRIREGRN